MYDFHLHSNFSMDSKASMDSMCISAIEKDLKGICFTDHIDLDVTSNKLDFEFKVDDYLKNLRSMKYRYSKELQVFSGVEIGMQAHLADRYDDIIKNYKFDFVIMSIHALGENSMFISDYLEHTDPVDALDTYYKTMYECVQSYDNYDVLGHIDFIDRYFLDKSHMPKFDKVFPLIEDILKIVIQNGKGIEINTSSLRHGLDYLHPKLSVLKLYRDLGGEIITLGSDSHGPGSLAQDLKLAENLLKSLDYKKIYIFKERKKFPINI